MQTMMQAMQIQYYTAPYLTHQYYGVRGYYWGQNNFRGRGGRGAQRRGNWRSGRFGRGYSDLKHYFWTHGMCNQPGTDWSTPA